MEHGELQMESNICMQMVLPGFDTIELLKSCEINNSSFHAVHREILHDLAENMETRSMVYKGYGPTMFQNFAIVSRTSV